MTPPEAQTRIADLAREIDHHDHLYFEAAQPAISDREFNALFGELLRLEAAYPQFRLPDSPTQRVGGTLTKVFPLFKHRVPMRSLANTYSLEEVRDFDARAKRILGADTDIPYLCQPKIDGVALSLHYENGVLVAAVTRGNGHEGDDITANARTIRRIPLRVKGLDVPPYFEVRGEALMRRPVFQALNAARIEAGEEPLMNPRNTAAGTLKLQDSAVVANRKLDFMAFYLDIPGGGLPDSDHAALALLETWGFPLASPMALCHSWPELEAFIAGLGIRKAELDYDTDGVVIKADRFSQREELGFTAKSPRWAVAYKYESEQASTVLRDVVYQVGRTGYINPVAHLEPVLLAGTTVKRASLYNFDELSRLDLHIGDTVLVEKSGEIIPKVLSVNPRLRKPGALPVQKPTACPECRTPLVKFQEGEVAFYCPNELDCLPQVAGRLEHFAHRRAMNIEGLGSELVLQLARTGLARTPAELYDLTAEKLLSLERFGNKSADNLMRALEASRLVPFHRVLFALGIRMVGEGVAHKLALHFRSMDALATATPEAIATVHDVGERIAQSLVRWMQNPAHQHLLQRLKAAGLQFEAHERVAASDSLAGKKFVVSGTFDIPREDIKAMIEANGGVMASAISKATDFIIAGEKMGPAKLEKATKLGVPILTLEKLLEMVGVKE